MQRDQLHFTLCIRKIKQRFVGDHQLRPLARYPELLGGGAPMQVAWTGEEVELFDKSPLFEVHDDVDMQGVDGNLAGTAAPRQTHFRIGIAADHGGVQVPKAIDLRPT